MRKNNSLICSWILAAAFASTGIAAPITVTFSPSSSSYTVGQEFSIDLMANIPDPVVGWGLHLNYTPILALQSVSVGPLWFPVTGSEADDYGGLAFPTAVSGTGVLLATLNFRALLPGSATLRSSSDPLNLAEGFALETGGFADVTFTNGVVNVNAVPEPAAWQVLSCAGLAFLAQRTMERRGLRKKHNGSSCWFRL